MTRRRRPFKALFVAMVLFASGCYGIHFQHGPGGHGHPQTPPLQIRHGHPGVVAEYHCGYTAWKPLDAHGHESVLVLPWGAYSRVPGLFSSDDLKAIDWAAPDAPPRSEVLDELRQRHHIASAWPETIAREVLSGRRSVDDCQLFVRIPKAPNPGHQPYSYGFYRLLGPDEQGGSTNPLWSPVHDLCDAPPDFPSFHFKGP